MDYVQIALTVLLGDVSAVAGWFLLKNRLFATFAQFANQFIEELMLDAINHPEKLAPLMDAVTKQGMKSIGIEKMQSPQSLKIGGLKIPGYVVEQAMPIIQRYFLGKGKEVVNEALKSPFG